MSDYKGGRTLIFLLHLPRGHSGINKNKQRDFRCSFDFVGEPGQNSDNVSASLFSISKCGSMLPQEVDRHQVPNCEEP